MRQFRYAVLIAAAIILCCHDAGLATAPTHRAWSDLGAGGGDIFYETSSHPGAIMRVTASPADDITPALCRDGDGLLRIFWVSRDAGGQRLYTSNLTTRGWDTPRPLPTGGRPASHPTAALDHKGVLWLAWTGFDGQDDDIFIMSLESGVWSDPQRINSDDDTPDVYPILGLDDDGVPWLYWRGFDGRVYSGYVSRRSAGAWSSERALGEKDGYRTLIYDELRRAALSGPLDAREVGTVYREGGRIPLLPARLQEALR